MKVLQSLLCTGLLIIVPAAVAEEFSNKPKPETMQQAIQFEKYKIAAAEAQARKDAAETNKSSQSTQRSARTKKTARKTGQADSAKAKKE